MIDFELKIGDFVNFEGLHPMRVLEINDGIAKFKLFSMSVENILNKCEIYQVVYSKKKSLIPRINLTVEQAEQLGIYKNNKFTVVIDSEFED